jgi:hypothetical protein
LVYLLAGKADYLNAIMDTSGINSGLKRLTISIVQINIKKGTELSIAQTLEFLEQQKQSSKDF